METKNHLYDIEMECSVIGAIMSYAKALDDIRGFTQVETFSESLHRDVYTAALTLSQKGEGVDIVSVVDELRRMGVCKDTTPFDVASLSGKTSPNFYYHAQVLHELFSRRRTWEVGQKLAARSTDMTFDLGKTLEEANDALNDIFSVPGSSIVTMREAMIELYDNYVGPNSQGETQLTGAPTGFTQFDEKSGGLHPGNLVVIAAETSQGKTSFAISIAVHAAKHAHRVAVYSLEMGNAELTARISAAESGLPVNRILYSKLLQAEMVTFTDGAKKLQDLPIYFDDKSTSNIDVIISSIRTMTAKYGINGIVIDYLQILNVNMRGTNKEQQMAEIARRLKNLARELNIWILALSQLNRDHTNHVPSLNRLRDSGQIAEAADIVALLYRPDVYGRSYPEPFKSTPTKGTAMVDIAKGRNIGLRKFIVGFNPSTTNFYNLGDKEVSVLGPGSIPISDMETVREESPF